MNKINIVIPMAGMGQRFIDAGYKLPKPIININNRPMIDYVVKSLNIDANYIFVVKEEDYNKYNLKNIFSKLNIKHEIVKINYFAQGSTISTLAAKKYFDNDIPLIIVNSDQIVVWNEKDFLKTMLEAETDGVIALFNDSHPKWSYAKIFNNNIIEVAEKKVISNNATVGIYGWKKGNDFIKYANQMIEKNITTNNEFYNCPVYNEAISDGKIIKPFFVKKMIPLGTPEDLENYLNENNIA